jgi:hypothetical protein
MNLQYFFLKTDNIKIHREVLLDQRMILNNIQ